MTRTYRKPTKGKDSNDMDFDSLISSESESKSSGAVAVTGRTRDYTVLHPSSMSVCNVTFQERPSEAGASTGSTEERRDATWRKKTELNARYE